MSELVTKNQEFQKYIIFDLCKIGRKPKALEDILLELHQGEVDRYT